MLPEQNPYEAPARADTAGPQRRDPKVGTALVLLWAATTVIAISGLVILSAARICEDYIELKMPQILSQSAGWLFGGAWIIASAAIVALGRGPRLRAIGTAALLAYFAGMLLIALQFLSAIWSPIWSIS